MSAHDNPFIKHIERAPYEIGYLLKKLPRDFAIDMDHPPEIYQMADALRRHAHNTMGTLLHGLEAIGKMMGVASGNEQNPLDASAIADVGCLIQHIAVEMQFLSEVHGECMDMADLKKQAAAKKKGGA